MESVSNAIVQISTSECIGKGIALRKEGLIVTNQHLVEGTPEVVITAKGQPPQLANVLYTDDVNDLAFVELPPSITVAPISFSEDPIQEDGVVFAFTTAMQSGKITQVAHPFFNIDYIQTDIPIDTDFSGSPLLNEAHQIIGLISGLLQNGNQKSSFALPSAHIVQAIADFKNANSNSATRCRNCKIVVVANTVAAGNRCPSCGESVELPHQIAAYESEGVSRTIEALIKELGHEPALTRRGPYHWALIEGSATIYLSYYEPRGYIMGDAFLCQLPENKNMDAIYEYLLRQNYLIKGLTLSINQKDIVLSLIIYDRHLNTDTAKELLQTLLEKADYYDNVLVEKYGAVWKK